MKTIFIKDDRLREIIDYRSKEITRLMLNGTLTGSYTIHESTKEYKTRQFPFYEILFGWDVIDTEDDWKLKSKQG